MGASVGANRRRSENVSKATADAEENMGAEEIESGVSECPPGSPKHKALRWREYKERGGEWEYDRWSNVYESNMVKAREANKAVDAFHEELGWGEREVTVKVGNATRRLDIADVEGLRGIEHKTGYQYLSEEIRSEVARDGKLVGKGWDITWHFEGSASQPLLDELAKNGIGVSGL